MEVKQYLGSNREFIQSSIKYLHRLKTWVNLYSHTQDIPAVFFFILTIILFYLQAKFYISTPFMIFGLLLGLFTSYVTLRVALPKLKKEISTTLENINYGLKYTYKLPNLIEPLSTYEVGHENFVKSIPLVCNKLRNKVFVQYILGTLPSVAGVLGYVHSL